MSMRVFEPSIIGRKCTEWAMYTGNGDDDDALFDVCLGLADAVCGGRLSPRFKQSFFEWCRAHRVEVNKSVWLTNAFNRREQ